MVSGALVQHPSASWAVQDVYAVVVIEGGDHEQVAAGRLAVVRAAHEAAVVVRDPQLSLESDLPNLGASVPQLVGHILEPRRVTEHAIIARAENRRRKGQPLSDAAPEEIWS